MNILKWYILKYPSRVKYGLIIANAFIILVAVKMYINYVSIEDTIGNTILQRQQETNKTNFMQNFLLNYEKSEYARYFLQHENNILWPWEFIIRFIKKTEKTPVVESTDWISSYDQKQYIKNPQESRNYFINDKLTKIK